jgi:hypothetical protein
MKSRIPDPQHCGQKRVVLTSPKSCRVVDADSFESGSGHGPGNSSESGSGSRVFMTKFKEKNTAENFLNFFFGSKILIYLSLGHHKGRLSYRRSLQPSKENIH